MHKKTRNLFNNSSVTSLKNETELTKLRLRPLKIKSKNKLFINSSQSNIRHAFSKKIPVSFFQDNEVNIVRNLNIENETDFFANLFPKGNIEINMMNEEELLTGSENNKTNKVNLPKIKNITIDTILESEKRLNLNKKISMRNMANNHLEKEMHDNLKEIKTKINDLQNRKIELYKNFDLKTKQIKDIHFDLDVLKIGKSETTLNNILDLNINALSTNKKEDSKNMTNSSLGTNPERKEIKNQKQLLKPLFGKNKYEDKIQGLKMLYLAKKENEEKKAENERKLIKLKEENEKISKEVKEIRNELIELKLKENDYEQKLMSHYEGLLYQGRDTRNDGLIWIIKSMWKLGKNVPMQYIPSFLDFRAIEFLFKLANKSIELENNKNLLNKTKKDLTYKIHKLYFSNNDNKTDIKNFSPKLFEGINKKTSLLFKTNLIKKNSILKRSVSQTNIVKSYIHSTVDDEQREQEKNNFKEISKFYENKNNNVEIEKMDGMENIEILQTKIKNIENEIIELKNNEVIRIFKEFVENDYQHRYNVTIDVVLAALLGEHMKNIEVYKFAKFKKEYLDNLKNIRFFEYRKKNDSK